MILRPLLFLLSTVGVPAPQSAVLAAEFPQTVAGEVCGAPALSGTVEGAVEGAIQTQLKTAADSSLIFDPPSCPSLAPGQSATIRVHVTVTAPGRDQGSGAVTVTIKNTGLNIGHDELLWFCNKPENLKSEGPLFDGELEPAKPVRLLYHHQNRGSHPLFMRILAINPTDQPADLMIIPGDGRPNRDPVWSGLKSARDYLPAVLVGSGEVVHLPPHKALPIGFRRLVMGDTASGICSLRLHAGGADRVEIRAEAVEPFETDREWTQAMLDTCPWHWVTPFPVPGRVEATYDITPLKYVNPYVEASLVATVGESDVSTKVGVEGIPRLGGGRGLNGNYGVIHTLNLTLSNPTKKQGHVDFFMDAFTDYTAGIFVFPERTIWLRPLQKKESRWFYKVFLAPGETKRFKIQSMPISGGWYPAVVRLHAVADS